QYFTNVEHSAARFQGGDDGISPLESHLLRGLNSAAGEPDSPGIMVSRSSPLAVFQNFTVWSALPEARVLPSGEKARAQMVLVCPLNQRTSSRAATSQRMMAVGKSL